MISCAVLNSVPPTVCTYCTDQYIAMKEMEFKLKNLTEVNALDNSSCAQLIYNNYVVSYISELSELVSKQFWTESRCDSCVIIQWNFTDRTEYSFHDNAINFQKKLYEWRSCVTDYFSSKHPTNITLCDECKSPFTQLFEFYWDVYANPNELFCLDIETTMNDTMNLWRSVWGCKSESRKVVKRDYFHVAVIPSFLLFLAGVFYIGSYTQGERKIRKLVQYSRLEEPDNSRVRILGPFLDSTSSGFPQSVLVSTSS